MRIAWLMSLTQYIILLRVTTSQNIPSNYGDIHQCKVDKKDVVAQMTKIIERQTKRLSFLESYISKDQKEKMKMLEFKEQMDREESVQLKQELTQLQEIVHSFRLESSQGHFIIKRQSNHAKNDSKVIKSKSTKKENILLGKCLTVSKFCLHPDQNNRIYVDNTCVESNNGASNPSNFIDNQLQSKSSSIPCNDASYLSRNCVSVSTFCLYPDKKFKTADKIITAPTNTDQSSITGITGTPYSNTVVCFVVRTKTPPFNKPQEILKFEEEVLNLGRSFDLKENIFTAPKTGIYEFTFNGYHSHKTGKTESLNISLRLNGNDVLNAWSDRMKDHSWSNDCYMADPKHRYTNQINMHSMLKVNKGDRIHLFNKQGNLHGDNIIHTQFTGKLMWENTTDELKKTRLIDGNTHNEMEKKAAPLAVYFVAQKNISFSNSEEVIPFEIVDLNVGEAFGLENNYSFIAPVNGIYEFTVQGYKTGVAKHLEVSLRLNKKSVAKTWTDFLGYENFHTPFSIYSILQLEKGDRIDLYLSSGNLYDDENHYTQFTGKLLKEINNNDDKKVAGPMAVYFNVQKNASFSTPESIIPFEVEVLNYGEAFSSLKDNFFTAPRSGIYEFTMKGYKSTVLNDLYVALRLNAKPIEFAWADYVRGHRFYSPFVIHSIFRVKQGDRIDLYNVGEGVLYDDSNNNTHFTGKLLFWDADIK